MPEYLRGFKIFTKEPTGRLTSATRSCNERGYTVYPEGEIVRPLARCGGFALFGTREECECYIEYVFGAPFRRAYAVREVEYLLHPDQRLYVAYTDWCDEVRFLPHGTIVASELRLLPEPITRIV